MGDVIRKGVIEIETRQKKSRLEAPDVSHAVRAHEALAKAANQAVRSQENLVRSAHDFSIHTVHSFERAGHGALAFGRGLALLSASGEEDMKRLAQSMVLVEGGVGAMRGALTVTRSLTTALGPLGLAASAVTLLASAGAVAWNAYAAAEERAVKKTIELRNKSMEAARSNAAANRTMGSRSEDLRERFAETEDARRQALTGAMGSSRVEADRLRSGIDAGVVRRKMIKLPDGTEITPEEYAARRPGILDAAKSGAIGMIGRAQRLQPPNVVESLDPEGAQRQLARLKGLGEEQERQLELQKQLNDADDEQLRRKQQQSNKLLDVFGLGLPEQALQRQRDELDRVQQENINRLLSAAQETNARIRSLEQDIAVSHMR